MVVASGGVPAAATGSVFLAIGCAAVPVPMVTLLPDFERTVTASAQRT
jgi:hypothetical protein